MRVQAVKSPAGCARVPACTGSSYSAGFFTIQVFLKNIEDIPSLSLEAHFKIPIAIVFGGRISE